MEPVQRITAALEDVQALTREELQEICTVLDCGLDKLEALEGKITRTVVCLDDLKTSLAHDKRKG